LHRDLKPSNVLLTREGVPRLTDFGLAKHFTRDEGQTPSGAIVGTPSYMAPEQARGRAREVGPRTDVYALGATLYELLTGIPPFRGGSQVETLLLVQTTEPEMPSRRRRGLSRELEAICLKCLEKDPARRYASAAALADDLDHFLHGQSTVARPLGWPARLWRGVIRWRAVLAVAALLLVSILATATVLRWGDNPLPEEL